jgi:hypothetical protein
MAHRKRTTATNDPRLKTVITRAAAFRSTQKRGFGKNCVAEGIRWAVLVLCHVMDDEVWGGEDDGGGGAYTDLSATDSELSIAVPRPSGPYLRVAISPTELAAVIAAGPPDTAPT